MKNFDGIKKINKKTGGLLNFSNNPVKDVKKRKFIKMAGIAGVGALVYSLIPKQAQAIIFGSSMRTDSVGIKNIAGTQINSATEAKQDDIIENQTDGSQKTQVVDSGGSNVDFATEAKQDEQIDLLDNNIDNLDYDENIVNFILVNDKPVGISSSVFKLNDATVKTVTYTDNSTDITVTK